MKVVFLCYFGNYGRPDEDDVGHYEWDSWFMLEDYPYNEQNPGIERGDDNSILGFDIIADISDEWKDGIPNGREDAYSADVHPALWKGIKAVFPPNGAGVVINQETLEDYATRFPQIYADAFGQEVEA